MEGIVIDDYNRTDVILTALSTLSSIIRPCLGLYGNYQMLTTTTSTSDKSQQPQQHQPQQQQQQFTVKLSNKGAEILKLINLEHPITNIIKRASHSLEYTSYDGTSSLVILIEQAMKELYSIPPSQLHPISMVYSLQKMYGQVVSDTISSMKKPLVKLSDGRTFEKMTREEILNTVVDMDESLLYNSIFSSIHTKLKDDNQCKEIASLCKDTIMKLYPINTQQHQQQNTPTITVSYIMKNRLVLQDQVIINPIISLNADDNKTELISNGWLLEYNHYHYQRSLSKRGRESDRDDKENYFKDRLNARFILVTDFIGIEEQFENNNNTDQQNQQDATKLSYSSSKERNLLVEREKELIRNKIKYLISDLKVDAILTSSNIDQSTFDLIYDQCHNNNDNNNSRIPLIFSNVPRQTLNVISRSSGIKLISSILQLQQQQQQQQQQQKQELDNNNQIQNQNIGVIDKIQLIRGGATITSDHSQYKARFEGLHNCKFTMVSAIICATSQYVIQQKVGAYITGMGVTKCCFEDLYVLPGACAVEFKLMERFKSITEATKDTDEVDKTAANVLFKTIQSLISTNLVNSSLNTTSTISNYFKRGSPSSSAISSSSYFPPLGINIQRMIDKKQPYLIDPMEKGIIDGYRCKLQMYKSVIDTICLFLKIDQIIYPPNSSSPSPSSSSLSKPQNNNKIISHDKKKRQHIEFQAPSFNLESTRQKQIEITKKKNELFYRDEEIQRRRKMDQIQQQEEEGEYGS